MVFNIVTVLSDRKTKYLRDYDESLNYTEIGLISHLILSVVFKWKKKRDLWPLSVISCNDIENPFEYIHCHKVSEWYLEPIHWNFHLDVQYLFKLYTHYLSALCGFVLKVSLNIFAKTPEHYITKYYLLNVIHEIIYFYSSLTHTWVFDTFPLSTFDTREYFDAFIELIIKVTGNSILGHLTGRASFFTAM